MNCTSGVKFPSTVTPLSSIFTNSHLSFTSLMFPFLLPRPVLMRQVSLCAPDMLHPFFFFFFLNGLILNITCVTPETLVHKTKLKRVLPGGELQFAVLDKVPRALCVHPAVMGNMISTGLELVGTASSPRLNERLARAVKRTVELANSQDITPRERLHVTAMELFAQG